MTVDARRVLADVFKETASAHDRFVANGLDSVIQAANAQGDGGGGMRAPMATGPSDA